MPPHRYFIGSALCAVAIGAALTLDVLGPVSRPAPLVLQFSRGTALSDGEAERLSAFIGRNISEAKLRFHVLGHTGERGDSDANLELSKDRAELVATRMTDAGIDPERIVEVEGIGAVDPLPHLDDGESDSAYQRRLSRVVITTVVSK